ncbi:MAG: PIN domain-containing protein [Deltaproteobacteria bacterium]|nr:PIN domain-containing protein [Deltaproteobacteria bacterium]
MICADTSVFIDFFKGSQTPCVEKFTIFLVQKQLLMNPFVLSELLSSPKLPKKAEVHLLSIPKLTIMVDFFERAGYLRRKIYQSGQGISMVDIYIAQICIDHEISLLTLDRDFFLISRHSNLKVINVSLS